MAAVLIVDDDEAFRKSLAQLACAEGLQTLVAGSLQQAREVAASHRIDLFALDLDLEDGNGLELLSDLDLSDHGRVVVITGTPSVETAARAVALPIVEYLVKPIHISQWVALLRETRILEESGGGCDGDLVGESEVMRALRTLLLKAAPLGISVLLTGETGTGKELAARMLHEQSGRVGPFFSLNCGAVPHELLASQLFGHERGSFTGAHNRHLGAFETAAHGTLFLDEITEMPVNMQVYLLRALETGSITRVGGSDIIETPVRVVAATNRDPLEAVAQGRLREDLYYRLADTVVRMPSLRERGSDVVLLAETFVQRLNSLHGHNKRIASGSLAVLGTHGWPGNVRELRSAVQRAYLLGSGDVIQVAPVVAGAIPIRETEESVLFTVGMSAAEVEKRMLLKTLEHCRNDKKATAKVLGISVRTVHNQLARMGAKQAHDGRRAP